MERLTDKKSRNPIFDAQGGLCVTAEFVKRLAEYEDTGLSPEEIKALIEPSSDPLTLEELCEMEGLPVYVKWNATEGFYCIISSTGEKELYYTEQNAHTEYAPFALYGNTWIAYRRKPEGGAK